MQLLICLLNNYFVRNYNNNIISMIGTLNFIIFFNDLFLPITLKSLFTKLVTYFTFKRYYRDYIFQCLSLFIMTG